MLFNVLITKLIETVSIECDDKLGNFKHSPTRMCKAI